MKSKRFFHSLFFTLLLLQSVTLHGGTFQLTANSPNTDLGPITSDDIANGSITRTNASYIYVLSTSNNWNLYVRTDDPNMGTVSSYTKPLSSFKWKASGSTASQRSYTKIKNSDKKVASGSKDDDQQVVNISYKITLDWEEPPGNYNLELLYTLVSNGSSGDDDDDDGDDDD